MPKLSNFRVVEYSTQAVPPATENTVHYLILADGEKFVVHVAEVFFKDNAQWFCDALNAHTQRENK